MTTHPQPVLLPVARQVVTFWPVSLQLLMVLSLIFNIIVRLLLDMDTTTFANIMFMVNAPFGLTIVGAHAVLAVERAVLTEQATTTVVNAKVST